MIFFGTAPVPADALRGWNVAEGGSVELRILDKGFADRGGGGIFSSAVWDEGLACGCDCEERPFSWVSGS